MKDTNTPLSECITIKYEESEGWYLHDHCKGRFSANYGSRTAIVKAYENNNVIWEDGVNYLS